MKITKILITTIAILTLSISTLAGEYSHSTPAVQGYDVVSYHTGKRPVRGNGHFIAIHKGATYQFSSKGNLKTFEDNPDRYVPAYGGYCAFGTSVGKKFIGDPEVWRIVGDTLYLNLDTSIQSEWLKDVPVRIKIADTKWKKIKLKSPASL